MGRIGQEKKARMGCERMASRTAGIVTVLFVLSFALLATGTHGSPPLSTSVKAIDAGKLAEMKAHVQNKKQVHMLAEDKAKTEKKSDDDGDEVTGFGGMKYKRTKEEEAMAKKGPSFSDIWQIRELFARCFGYALVAGICLLILGCCVTQRGCMIYDKYLDKDPYYNRVEGEDVALAGDTSKK